MLEENVEQSILKEEAMLMAGSSSGGDDYPSPRSHARTATATTTEVS